MSKNIEETDRCGKKMELNGGGIIRFKIVSYTATTTNYQMKWNLRLNIKETLS